MTKVYPKYFLMLLRYFAEILFGLCVFYCYSCFPVSITNGAKYFLMVINNLFTKCQNFHKIQSLKSHCLNLKLTHAIIRSSYIIFDDVLVSLPLGEWWLPFSHCLSTFTIKVSSSDLWLLFFNGSLNFNCHLLSIL